MNSRRRCSKQPRECWKRCRNSLAVRWSSQVASLKRIKPPKWWATISSFHYKQYPLRQQSRRSRLRFKFQMTRPPISSLQASITSSWTRNNPLVSLKTPVENWKWVVPRNPSSRSHLFRNLRPRCQLNKPLKIVVISRKAHILMMYYHKIMAQD